MLSIVVKLILLKQDVGFLHIRTGGKYKHRYNSHLQPDFTRVHRFKHASGQ